MIPESSGAEKEYVVLTLLTQMRYPILKNIDPISSSKKDSSSRKSGTHNELKRGKNSNFKCVFGWLHDYLKD